MTHVQQRDHSFTCHPHTKHTCLYSPATRCHLIWLVLIVPEGWVDLSGWSHTEIWVMSSNGNWTRTQSPIQVLTDANVPRTSKTVKTALNAKCQVQLKSLLQFTTVYDTFLKFLISSFSVLAWTEKTDIWTEGKPEAQLTQSTHLTSL